MRIVESSEEAKERFARETDDINRLSQRDGPGFDAAEALAAILAEHEQECAAMMREFAPRGRDDSAK